MCWNKNKWHMYVYVFVSQKAAHMHFRAANTHALCKYIYERQKINRKNLFVKYIENE